MCDPMALSARKEIIASIVPKTNVPITLSDALLSIFLTSLRYLSLKP